MKKLTYVNVILFIVIGVLTFTLSSCFLRITPFDDIQTASIEVKVTSSSGWWTATVDNTSSSSGTSYYRFDGYNDGRFTIDAPLGSILIITVTDDDGIGIGSIIINVDYNGVPYTSKSSNGSSMVSLSMVV